MNPKLSYPSIPQAVSLVVLNGPNTALAISRRNDTTQWGFPGGKVDPGEDAVTAIRREAFEETGLQVAPDQLVALYGGHVMGTVPYWTTFFLYLGETPQLNQLTAEQGMVLKWLDLPSFCRKDISPFAAYNLKALDFLETYLTPPPRMRSMRIAA